MKIKVLHIVAGDLTEGAARGAFKVVMQAPSSEVKV